MAWNFDPKQCCGFCVNGSELGCASSASYSSLAWFSPDKNWVCLKLSEHCWQSHRWETCVWMRTWIRPVDVPSNNHRYWGVLLFKDATPRAFWTSTTHVTTKKEVRSSATQRWNCQVNLLWDCMRSEETPQETLNSSYVPHVYKCRNMLKYLLGHFSSTQ